MSQNFPELYEHSGENVKFELDLSDYARKANLKEATGIDTSTLASETDMASLQTKVDNLDVGKLKTVPTDLSKLSKVVDNGCQNCLLFTKVNAISTNIPSTNGLKQSIIRTNKVLNRRLN